MISYLSKPKRLLFINKLLCINFCFLVLSSCISIPKIPLHSKNLIFNIQWDVTSPSKEKQNSFKSLVFIQGDNLLRLDIFQPLIGTIGSLVLNNTTMTLLVPSKKSYYKGEFDSKVFFPDFPAFPSSWLIALLRAETPQTWNCQKHREKTIQCKTDHFEVEWKYKRSQLNTIRLKDLKQRQIKIQIRSLFSKQLTSELFEPSLNNLKREETPFFLQKI